MSLIKKFSTGYNQPGGLKDLLSIAFPMMISTACDGVMTLTDRLFLGRVGSEQMNAALSGGVSYQMMTFFIIGLTGYSTALIAQYYGAKEYNNAPKALFQAVLITVIAWPLILLAKPLVVSSYGLLSLPESQIGFQIQYLNILVYGSLFGMMRQTMSCFFSGIGKTKIVMTATITAMIVNVVLDYILIYGKLGFEPMGVRGAAIATVTGSVSALVVLLIAYFMPKIRHGYSVMKSFHFDWTIMKKLFRYGSPAGLEFFMNFLAFYFMTLIFQSQGSAEATATTIMFNWDLVSFIPLVGIEIAVTSLAGRYMGAENPELAQKSAVSAMKAGLIYSSVILLLFLMIPEILVRVYHPAEYSATFEQSVPIAKMMIRIASLYVLAQAFMVAMVGTLRGAGDTFYTMLVSVSANWAFIPMLLLTFYVFKMPLYIGWSVMVFVYLVFCYVMYKRYRKGKWKTIKVIHE